MTARTLAALVLLAVAPAATARADYRDYVDSGQYLADVTAAAAPASAWLLARTDTIARQAELCRAAGYPLQGATLTPAATDTGSGATIARAAARGRAAQRGVAVARGRAVPRGVMAASAATPYGAVTIRFDRSSALARAKVVVRAVAPASASAKGRVLTLPVARGTVEAMAAKVWSAGAVRFVRGARAVTFKDIRLEVSAGRGRLVGGVGARRMTVLRFTVPKDAQMRAGLASARAAPATLTTAAAKALGARVRAGRVGTLALRADLRRLAPQVSGQSTTTAPAPAGAAPSSSGAAPTPGEPGLTVVPASPGTCAATPAHPALVLDLDETALSNYIDTWGDPDGGDAGQAGPAMFGQSTAMAPILDLYGKARARGVAVFFITARPGIIELATRDNLERVGYGAYEGLSFKNDLAATKDAYKSAQRAAVEARGYRIILNVGDQQTDLDGGHAERAFKLPNPFY